MSWVESIAARVFPGQKHHDDIKWGRDVVRHVLAELLCLSTGQPPATPPVSVENPLAGRIATHLDGGVDHTTPYSSCRACHG